MVREVTIKNYKSIRELKFELGRVNVIIGENGAGKSNILEAFIIAAAAYQRKLDDEFLANRGIRTTDPKAMKSGFDAELQKKNIYIELMVGNEGVFIADIERSNEPYGGWINKGEFSDFTTSTVQDNEINDTKVKEENLTNQYRPFDEPLYMNLQTGKPGKSQESELCFSVGLKSFLTYYPNLKAMIARDKQSYIKPLGIYGDGLLEFLSVIKKQYPDEYSRAVDYMHLFNWFSKMEVTADSNDELLNGDKLQIFDRYLEDGLKYFDQRNVNEGFFFILFYYLLFNSKLTPKFFAVDNIDTSLNPRLCIKLMEDIAQFTKKHNKQTILTTHNPSLLDGMDLYDDEQRLFVAYRNADGETKLERKKPNLKKGKVTIRNSEAFIRGHFGGLPKQF